MSTSRIKVLIDGACPLCRREADLWRRLDRGRGRIELVDISAPGFDPGRFGLTQGAVMDQIHGILPGGEVVRGMEVFRRAYAAVGWGWVLAPTACPLLRPVADRAYEWFARRRLRLTRRNPRAAGCSTCGDGPASATVCHPCEGGR